MIEQKFSARHIRKTVLEMALGGSTVHIPCAFSIVEILAVLYRNHVNTGDNPTFPERDYLVLSKGHGVMAQYACLQELGWLSKDDLANYFKDGTRLKGLSDGHVPGLEVTSGSLGHGLSVGVGLALAAKLNGTSQRVFAIIGDGESNEGTIWEALLFASHWKLDNLVVIVDVNGFQAMGSTSEVMELHELKDKFSAFNFETAEVDGHDELSLDITLNKLKLNLNGRPKGLIAKTIKGKGVTFMEHNNTWHYTRLNEETFAQAMKELGF